MRDSVSDTQGYLDVCRGAVQTEDIFSNFKAYPPYQAILEHAGPDIAKAGQLYLDIICDQDEAVLDHLDKFLENDKYGSPFVADYSIGTCSPTTLSYIKILTDLKKFFGSLDDMNIVEIGCGYGGQSKIICDVYDVKSYTYIDLPDVVKLIEKYTNRISVNTDKKFIASNEVDEKIEGEYDLVISNYAFTECIPSVQKKYIDLVLNNSKRGYITCNFINSIFGLEAYSKDQLVEYIKHDVKEYEETPNTFSGNCVLGWDSNDQ